MKSFALREQIETSFGARAPRALSPQLRSEPARIACGDAAVDALLCGGLAVGAITEFVGDIGSGLTTTAVAYVSSLTQAGSVCVWIDAADSFDPESAAANDVDLERLLWVRCGSQAQASAQDEAVCQGVSVPLSSSVSQPRHTGGGSPHPRSEGRDMPAAISAMLHRHGGLYDRHVRREAKAIGTPGMPNRPLSQRSEDREEQVNSDRLPPRRGENLSLAPRCAEPQPRRPMSGPTREHALVAPSVSHATPSKASTPWHALDQALRATDLLLQSGGFSAIVLDLGSVRPEFAWRVPLATWFRFRAACERTQVSLILLTQHPCARSSAEIVVRLHIGSMEAQGKVMTGVHFRAAVERNRSHEPQERVVPIRKPPQSARPGEGLREAAWARAK